MAAVKVDPAHVHEFGDSREFERWGPSHQDNAHEVWIKFHKVASGMPSITPKEA